MSDEQPADNAVHQWFDHAKPGIYTTVDVQVDMESFTELDIHRALRRLASNQDGFRGTGDGRWQVYDPLEPTRRVYR